MAAEQFRGQPRLPKFATPRRYDLRLMPDLDACAFSGSVAVSLDVAAPTRFLVLNAAELDVAPGAVSFAPQGSDKVISRSLARLLALSWDVSTSEFDLFWSEAQGLEF
jgi:puromycin-sensitive aminopeptidase